MNSKTIQQYELMECRRPGTDLSSRTTLGVGPEIDQFFEPTTLEELYRIRELSREKDLPLVLLGGGSNLLFTDRVQEALVVQLSNFTDTGLRKEEDTYVLEAEAGARLPALVRRTVEDGWKTFGRLAGIPGTVGGAIWGNSGTRHGAIGGFVRDVFVLAPDEPREVQVEDPKFSYRSSNLQDEIVLRVVLEGTNLDEDVEDPPSKKIQKKRMNSQPISDRSAGCMFKNPKGDSAGRLIDEAGLKGERVGNVSVSEVHANFVINEGNAEAEDVLQLIENVRERVREKFGVELEREIQIF